MEHGAMDADFAGQISVVEDPARDILKNPPRASDIQAMPV
jgi:hypothetical protein